MFPPDLLANTPGIDAQLFYSQPSASWQAWHKPQGRSFLYMIAIGAGGGGGGGDSSGVVGGGGGGGGAIVTALIPLFAVPDILYVNVSAGGVGGLANANASAAATTYIASSPTNTRGYAIASVACGVAGSAGGGAGGAGGATSRPEASGSPCSVCGTASRPGGRGGRQFGGRDHDHAGGQHDLDVRRRRRRRRRQRGRRHHGSRDLSDPCRRGGRREPRSRLERLAAPRQHQRLDVLRRVWRRRNRDLVDRRRRRREWRDRLWRRRGRGQFVVDRRRRR